MGNDGSSGYTRHRKLTYPTGECTGRLVTTGVGGAVFGFRLYTAVRLLSVKSSWLAPITGWLEGIGPIY